MAFTAVAAHVRTRCLQKVTARQYNCLAPLVLQVGLTALGLSLYEPIPQCFWSVVQRFAAPSDVYSGTSSNLVSSAADMVDSRPSPAEARKPVWLDCDPGHDDAMAIILAGYSPVLKLLGISTVASNQVVEKTTRNAIDVLDLCGLQHIDVVMGQAKPLLRETALLCPEIHGTTGLDGPYGVPVLPHSSRQHRPGKAVNLMFEAIQQQYSNHPTHGKVQLICTGALTNIALLLLLYPEVKDMIEITIMGGALGVGNTGPVQEFNIQVDPEAAKVVFDAGVPLTMVPLEVTHTALATPEVLSRMFGSDSSSSSSTLSPFKALVQLLLTYFEMTYKEVFKFHAGAPLHDPCAVAAVIAPHLFEFELMRVDIETISPLAAGQTICDIWHTSQSPKNCSVAKQMNVDAFWDLLLSAVDAADAVAPMNTAAQAVEATLAAAATDNQI